jgi:hypothetical protein
MLGLTRFAPFGPKGSFASLTRIESPSANSLHRLAASCSWLGVGARADAHFVRASITSQDTSHD